MVGADRRPSPSDLVALIAARARHASAVAALRDRIGNDRVARLVHQLYRRLSRPAWLGTLRRTTPLSDEHGFDRGTPVDRYYIEGFLEEHRQDIRGRVLEVRDSGYTDRFGHELTQRAVLDINSANPLA